MSPMRCAVCLLLTLAAPGWADEWAPVFTGHVKGQAVVSTFPDDSALRDLIGTSGLDLGGVARLNFSATRAKWDVKADYQFIAIRSDSLAAARPAGASALPPAAVINDERRWFDLTHTITDTGRRAVVQRLDRLSVGLTTERTAWRFGRQAISWGNGLLFTPMDIFNPFDPAAVDKEYKTGDDMLYGQVLLPGGGDLQGVAVVRRDPRTGNVESGQSSLALKYHGFAGANEFDLLLAEHFDDQVLGLGGIIGVGGAIWRGDLTLTLTDDDDYLSGTVSVSYAWTWGGHNVSGLLEVYRNGIGQGGGEYAPGELLTNPGLLERIGRGELFTLGRNYLGASASIELTPLVLLSPNVFVNLDDPSALAQLVLRYDWRQNLTLLTALNLPIGPPGSEYGGIETVLPARYLATGPQLFAQLAWYF